MASRDARSTFVPDRRSDIEISVIVPVGRRHSRAPDLYKEYKAGLDALGQPYEMIFVLDGRRDEFASGLRELLSQGERFTVVHLTREFGEGTALAAGLEQASGQTIVTLPAYEQIEAVEVEKLVRTVGLHDVAIGWRRPRAGGAFERGRRWLFHRLLRSVTGLQYHDLGRSTRAFSRRVLDEIHLYGGQHRYVAVLADRQGFKVHEVPVRQSPRDRFQGRYEARDYARSLLDLLTIAFLVRFTKKPLRFFGMLGVGTFGIGALLVTGIILERLLFGHALAERPALLLSSLLLVLGLQLFALGLLGELIIFTHARSIKDYQVERVIRFSAGRELENAREAG